MKKITFKIILALLILTPFVVSTAALALNTDTTNYALLEPEVVGKAGDTATVGFIEYLQLIVKSVLALIVILSVLKITYGGILWIWSAIPMQKADGATQIRQAIYGLLIALFSWLILYTINPNLVTNWTLTQDSVGQGNSSLGTDTTNQNPPEKPKPGEVPPIKEGTLTKDQASRAFNAAGVAWDPKIELAGLRQSTVDGVVDLKQASGANIKVTSATGGVHNSSLYSHANGYKVDLARNQKLSDYITKSGKFTRQGTIQGYPQYVSKDGRYRILQESDHWDVRVNK